MSRKLPFEFAKGAVVAVPLSDGVYGYAVELARWMVYPLLSRGGFLPFDMLGDHNWRWLVSAPGPERQKDWVFAGLHANYSKYPQKPAPYGGMIEDLSIRKDNIPLHWWYEPGAAFWKECFHVYRGPVYDDSLKRWDYPEDVETDFRALLLSGYPRMVQEPSLPAFMEAHRHEMTLLEPPFARLVDAYEGVDQRDAMHPNMRLREKFAILEVWMPPNLPPPKGADSLEDFVDELLSEKDLGGVGEFAEMDTYTLLSCDVTKPDRAAKTLLKAFKKSGYTSGIEIKEIGGKERVWTLD